MDNISHSLITENRAGPPPPPDKTSDLFCLRITQMTLNLTFSNEIHQKLHPVRIMNNSGTLSQQ